MDPRLRQLSYRIKRDWQNVSAPVKRTLFAILFGCLPALLMRGGYSDAPEAYWLRKLFELRGAREVPQSVTIVGIDELAYDAVGAPLGAMFPREALAKALERITALEPSCLFLDLLIHRPGDDPQVDARLSRALAAAPSVIGRAAPVVVEVDPQGKRRTRRRKVEPAKRFADAAKAVVPLEVRVSCLTS